MDGQKSQAKLTRTSSSLLRFSPSVRSSIQSLSSVSDIEADDLEEQKPHGRPVRPGQSRLAPVLAVILLSTYTTFSYEGDLVDGRYDGHGIESWARGSKYRGQYMQGLRHGYGVYKLYTGDSYAGEWCNGQGHGVGVQTCGDGSCFIGEFKRGVKHGLGCLGYYFF
ncbi:Histone H3 K4-specific methyltransferase SET7/9 family protein [Striga hermonthica]|uniref:Histone H3 K4-specific methyltransferase SET7/9 family protein n=1 Tax=Striga hermonthica TaxID=68872 RepID=A0A9N7MKR1_STRHE|nr:Histone H3 K4-specific methyltransferase SET7/9 family protein [Striga hermonthica]